MTVHTPTGGRSRESSAMGESLTERRRVVDEVLRDVKTFYRGGIPHFCSFGYNCSMHYVYVLRMRNDLLYVGSTNNLKRRLDEHSEGLSPHTSKYLPVECIYCEIYKSKLDALEREKKLKQHKSAFGHLRKRIQRSIAKTVKVGDDVTL